MQAFRLIQKNIFIIVCHTYKQICYIWAVIEAVINLEVKKMDVNILEISTFKTKTSTFARKRNKMMCVKLIKEVVVVVVMGYGINRIQVKKIQTFKFLMKTPTILVAQKYKYP